MFIEKYGSPILIISWHVDKNMETFMISTLFVWYMQLALSLAMFHEKYQQFAACFSEGWFHILSSHWKEKVLCWSSTRRTWTTMWTKIFNGPSTLVNKVQKILEKLISVNEAEQKLTKDNHLKRKPRYHMTLHTSFNVTLSHCKWHLDDMSLTAFH